MLTCVLLNIINIVIVHTAPFPFNQTISNEYIEESGKLLLKTTCFLKCFSNYLMKIDCKYLAIFLLLERRYFNWSQVIPAWKIDIEDSSSLPESNGLSYEERYVK